jgi:hypothetical protein
MKTIRELIWVGYRGRTLIGMLQYIHNEGNHIGIKADISSDNIQSHQHPKEVSVAQDAVPRNVAASMVVSEETYQTSCQENDKVGIDKFVQNAVVLEPSLNRRYDGCIIEDEKNVHVEQTIVNIIHPQLQLMLAN